MSSIPTTYNGIRFRSRLEAKWAVFFDQLRWTWHYEPLDLDGWIPDFLIETKTLPILVEVKPITKLDAALVSKIERIAGIYEYNEDNENNPYNYMICGLGLIKPEYEENENSIGWVCNLDWCANWDDASIIYPTEPNFTWGLTGGQANLWQDMLTGATGKLYRDYAREEHIAPLWAAACNVAQWKASR